MSCPVTTLGFGKVFEEKKFKKALHMLVSSRNFILSL